MPLWPFFNTHIPTMLYQSVIALENASVENFVPKGTPALEGFVSYFRDFFDRLKYAFDAHDKAGYAEKALLADYRPRFAKANEAAELARMHFSELSGIAFQCPKGFKAGESLDAYAKDLAACFAGTQELDTQLQFAITSVAALISNRSIKTSLDNTLSQKAASLKKARLAAEATMKPYFNNVSKDVLAFSAMYPHEESFGQSIASCSQLLDAMAEMPYRQISERFKDLFAKMEILIAQVTDENRDESMQLSRAQLTNLHDAFYEMALQAEGLAVNYYRALAVCDVTWQNMERLNKMFK